MDYRRIKGIIRSENYKLLRDYDKKVEQRFMTRKDCLSIHLGQYKPEQVNNSNGERNNNGLLKQQKIKFWGVLIGFVMSLTTLITVLVSILIMIYFS